MQLAVTGYQVVQSVHVMAVVGAYGLPLAYPLLIPYLRRRHPQAMPGVHDVQYRLNVWLTGPGTAIILAAGIYMASKHHLWGQSWLTVPVVIIVLIGVVGGAVIVPASRRMAALSRADVDAAASGGASVSWSREYQRVYGRYMSAEIFLGLLVLVAIFFMVAKP